MVAQIEIVSEMIKPSSPTPPENGTHKLYLFDQFAPPVYTSMILYYAPDRSLSRAEKSQRLKESLSKILTLYYPVAGRVTRDLTVDCNDAGAEFTEANVHADLAEFVNNPDIEQHVDFLPRKPHDVCGEIPLAVQINFFDCGGVAIGANMSHEIGDGTSFMTLLYNLSVMSRAAGNDRTQVNGCQVSQPVYNMCPIPASDLSASGFSPLMHLTMEKIVTRRFVIDKEKVSRIKEAITSAPGSGVKNPTRVEAVSAYFWKQFIERDEAKLSSLESHKTYAAYHAVNVRPRMSPPVPENAFGNIFTPAMAFSAPGSKRDYHNLAGLFRGAIKEINSDFLNKMKGEKFVSDYLREGVKMHENKEIVLAGFSSWCRFPVYDMDFGWGKPIWASTRSLPFKDLVILMGTKCGQGIEAWVYTLEGDEIVLPNDL